MSQQSHLTITDHNRDVTHMRYVYPVVSRRAQGVSVGINLNVNNACNWRCIYCQVPNLSRGTPPPVELSVLENELRSFLDSAIKGSFMQDYVDEADRHLQDIAFSGNGEPTSCKEFPQVISIVEKILHEFDLLGKIKVRLITNGSLIDKPYVFESLRHLSQINGEVWFKLDAGTEAGIARINDVNIQPKTHIERLRKCASACPTFVQTCMFAIEGTPPSEEDINAYLGLIDDVASEIKGVHLYGLARPSYQKEAEHLSRLSAEWLENVAVRIRQHGVSVQVSP